MCDDPVKEPTTGELLRLILTRLDTIELRLATVEEGIQVLDEKVDALREDVSVIRSQLDVFAADTHQIRAEQRRFNLRLAEVEKLAA